VIEQPFTLEALMQTSPLSVNLWQLPTRLRSTWESRRSRFP